MALSVGDDDRAQFTVDRNGDIVSQGDLAVAGDVSLGDDAQDSLTVAGESTFEADVQVNGALTVVNDGFTGDLVTLSGGGSLSDAGSVLVVEAEAGFPESNAVASIQRPGLGQVVEFTAGMAGFGIYALDSTNTSFRAALPGSLAVGVSGSSIAGRMFVMSVHSGGEGTWREVATSAQIGIPVLNGGNDTGNSPLQVGSTSDAPLQLITNGRVAMEIDEDQNVVVSGGNQLRFRDDQASLSSPASGELLARAENRLTLTSPGTIMVEAQRFDVFADMVNIRGELLVDSTLTVTGEAIFNGDVTLGDSSSDTVTILGSLQGLTFEGTQQAQVNFGGWRCLRERRHDHVAQHIGHLGRDGRARYAGEFARGLGRGRWRECRWRQHIQRCGPRRGRADGRWPDLHQQRGALVRRDHRAGRPGPRHEDQRRRRRRCRPVCFFRR